ncbi:VPS4-associated protein 1 [Dipodascopsis tothii]|uniref:VPS4-associated protein 1 n=1 Tax=Dipodascopsis tothii TaxID=44089 RepID=UPI0034CD8CB5
MSNPPFKNVYHVRRVAETSSRACTVCYKPSVTVLITEDGKSDFFYTCEAHLKDAGFASPVLDPAVEAAKARQAELERQIEAVKKEWEAKQKKKKAEAKAKKDKDETAEAADEAEPTEPRALAPLETSRDEQRKLAETEQRVYTLSRGIFMARLQAYHNAQRAKRTAELLRRPDAFPAVPRTRPGE